MHYDDPKLSTARKGERSGAHIYTRVTRARDSSWTRGRHATSNSPSVEGVPVRAEEARRLAVQIRKPVGCAAGALKGCAQVTEGASSPLTGGFTQHRSRRTWGIAGGIVVLLVLAGVDALRSPDTETAAPTTRPTTRNQPEPTTQASTTVEARGVPFDSERTIAITGDTWAPFFAAGRDGEACKYQTQPLCERITCMRAEGIAISNCDPPSSAFRRLFKDAAVESVEIRGYQAGARFSTGQEVVFVYPPGQGGWLIHKLRDENRKFFN